MRDLGGIMRETGMKKGSQATFNFFFFFHMLGRKRKGVSDL